MRLSPSHFDLRDEDVLPALLFIVFAGVAVCMPPHNDTWWLLRSGQEMWYTKTILLTERFSHTAYGATLNNHEWLTQLIFFGLFSLGGPFLLTLFCGVCVLGAVWGAWSFMRRGSDIRVCLLVALMLGTTPEWAVRPQTISLALLSLTVCLAITSRTAWLPLVCFVWANLHGMVLFGIVVAGSVALESLVWSRRRAARDIFTALACVLAPLVTPIGRSYWSQVGDTVSTSRILEIHEYRSAFEWGSTPFWLVVIVLIALAVRSWRLETTARDQRLLIMISGILAVAGALSVRNVPFFLLIALPAVSRLAPDDWLPIRHNRPAGREAAIFATLVLLSTVSVVAFRWRNGGERLGWHPMNSAAVDAIRRCSGPIFNGFADGGPIMWFVPGRQVFVDSRVEAYPFEILSRSRRADLDGDYEASFHQYGIGCAVVATDSLMANRLETNRTLAQLYRDPQWTVFEKRPTTAMVGNH